MDIKTWNKEMSAEETKDLAYWERNVLALRYADGWYFDHENNYPGWMRVLSLDNGKITFHVPDDFNVGDLAEIKPTWDGHTTEEKWRRILNSRSIKLTTLELGKQRASELGIKSTNPADWPPQMNLNQRVYRADDIHKLLGEGVNVTGHNDGGNESWWTDTDAKLCNHKATALLIGIRPIVPETREQKMEQIIREYIYAFGELNLPPELNERAKALLSEGK